MKQKEENERKNSLLVLFPPAELYKMVCEPDETDLDIKIPAVMLPQEAGASLEKMLRNSSSGEFFDILHGCQAKDKIFSLDFMFGTTTFLLQKFFLISGTLNGDASSILNGILFFSCCCTSAPLNVLYFLQCLCSYTLHEDH